MLHACLYTICFVFCYTSWYFKAFSGTNLLTRCHSASFLFLLFLCFRKATQEIFLELDETKAEVPKYLTRRRSPKMRQRGPRGSPHPRVVRPWPWPRHEGVNRPGPPPDDALSPISSPRREKPRGQISFPWNMLQATAAAVARLGGSRSSSRHPAGEGNPCRRPSTPPWSPLSDMWVVYLGLQVHSSS
jgi:hypothetical protein